MKSLWKYSALAAIAIGGVAQADVVATNTATGSELVLFVRDLSDGANPNRVYARGLGVTVDNILTAAAAAGAYPDSGIGSLTYTLPPLTSDSGALATFLAGGTSFGWTIMAADTLGTNPFNQRYVTTTPANLLSDPIPGNAFLTSSWNQIAPMFNSLNGGMPGTTLGTPVSVSINGLWGQIGSPYEGAYDWFGGQVLNQNVLGEAANFYVLSNSSDGPDELARVWSLGTITLGLDGVLSQVTNEAPPAVPLPPAIVLLGSAFAGLAGVARRRKLAAAA